MELNIYADFFILPKLLNELNISTDEFKLSAIINILKALPENRTPRNLIFLKALTSNIAFFKNHVIEIGESIQYQICQSLEYEYIDKGNVNYI